MDFLPENILALIVTTVIVTIISRITSFILKVVFGIALIAFLIYMFINYGPETIEIANVVINL